MLLRQSGFPLSFNKKVQGNGLINTALMITCIKLKKKRERIKEPHTKNNDRIFDHISLSNGIYDKISTRVS